MSYRSIFLSIACLLSISFTLPEIAYAQNNLANHTGCFIRSYQYQRGIEYGNPKYDGRFRVNGPESVTGNFHARNEVRENGMMQIDMPENLFHLDGAELYLEIWGGHPGTTNKRFLINGRNTYPLPDETQFHHCTYSYHTIPLNLTDLTFAGRNAIQFACDTGDTFWGIFIVDHAQLNGILKDDHPDLVDLGLGDFSAAVDIQFDGQNETMTMALNVPPQFVDRIEKVDFQGKYYSYDDVGTGKAYDWHGMTKWGQPYGILGSATAPELAIEFDYSMLPPSDCEVRATVYFKDQPNLSYRVPAVTGLKIPKRTDGTVLRLIYPTNTPAPMWSRAGRPKTCNFVITSDTSLIKRAQLHMKIWDGGAGEVENPITLNGHPVKVTEHGKHDLIYKIVEIDPAIIKRNNELRVLSDTLHHGIEVIYPGPALMIRRDNPQ